VGRPFVRIVTERSKWTKNGIDTSIRVHRHRPRWTPGADWPSAAAGGRPPGTGRNASPSRSPPWSIRASRYPPSRFVKRPSRWLGSNRKSNRGHDARLVARNARGASWGRGPSIGHPRSLRVRARHSVGSAPERARPAWNRDCPGHSDLKRGGPRRSVASRTPRRSARTPSALGTRRPRARDTHGPTGQGAMRRGTPAGQVRQRIEQDQRLKKQRRPPPRASAIDARRTALISENLRLAPVVRGWLRRSLDGRTRRVQAIASRTGR
jgi:hypothetical protein